MMARAIVTIPPSVLRVLNCDWDIDWRGQSLGATNAGITRTTYLGFPRWVGQPQTFLDASAIRAWRAVRATAQGRRAIYRVPIIDPVAFSPRETASQATTAAGLPFSTGAFFSTGVGFAYEPFATAETGASAGATALRVDVASCGGVAPKVGQIMSHDSWPFVVTSVTAVSGTLYDLTVQMPLRAAIAAGDAILMRGVGLFEAADEGMGNPAYGLTQTSRPELQFIEVLQR